MLLLQIILPVTLSLIAKADRNNKNTHASDPLESLRSATTPAVAEELRRERPIVFRPEDGRALRQDFEQKHGYRGERLIAKLGGGPTPLSIYDASLIKQSTPVFSSTVLPTALTKTTTQSPPQASSEKSIGGYLRRREKKQEGSKSATPVPVKRKYSDIRRKKDHILGKNSLKNSRTTQKPIIVTDTEPTPAAADEESYVQTRLYRAVWNHGLNGSPDPEHVNRNIRNLERLVPSNFHNLDLMQQLSGAIGLSAQPAFATSGQASDGHSVGSNRGVSDAQLLHALAAGAAAINTNNHENSHADNQPSHHSSHQLINSDHINANQFHQQTNNQFLHHGSSQTLQDSNNPGQQQTEDGGNLQNSQDEALKQYFQAINNQVFQQAFLQANNQAFQEVNNQAFQDPNSQLDLSFTPQPNENSKPQIIEGAEPSLFKYAGVGEPSLQVASYSYSGRLPPLNFGGNSESVKVESHNDGNAEQAVAGGDEAVRNVATAAVAPVQEESEDRPVIDPNDPLTGGSEIHARVVKP